MTGILTTLGIQIAGTECVKVKLSLRFITHYAIEGMLMGEV
jgi:hypothetical protein